MHENMLLLPFFLLALQPITAQQAKPPASLRTVHDVPDRLSFQVPSDWPLAVRDRELSTFHQEARSAPPTSRLRFVVAMPENPFPASTFSGAHFYLSVTLRQTQAQCAAQVISPSNSRPVTLDKVSVDHLPASHAHDEFGMICTQVRDDVYTLSRHGACVRFDLAMNNFCGGEVSGVPNLSRAEIQEVHRRLAAILDSVVFLP